MARGRYEQSRDDEVRFWGAVARRVSAPRPWMAEVRANVVFFMLGLIVLYFGWCVYDRFLGTLPSAITSATIVNHPYPGGRIDLKIDLVRHRICERDFEWIVQDRTGKRERFQEAHMHAIGNVGKDSFVQSFRLPADMEPGPAKLRVIWSWQCPQNLYETVYPVVLILHEIPFTISEKPP